MTRAADVDVAIVGASIAGCTAAILLARRGARVLLAERRTYPAAFKRVCGHFVQPSAVPTIERLGLLGEFARAGAVRGRARIWTRYGWIDPPDDGAQRESLSLRREVLDPILRRAAAETPGVELMLGATLDALGVDEDSARATFRCHGGSERTISARLLVGADGRGSRTAALAGLRTRTTRNNRFGYWSYFDGPGLESGAGVHVWFTEPDVGIATPTDSGLMLYAAFPGRSRLAEFKRDTEAALRAFIGSLPDAPPIADARRVGPIVGRLDLTNEWRRPTDGRVALVGDAAVAADPVGAIGCGWAFQSAEWLADSLAPALGGEEPLFSGLRRFRRRHRRALLGHFLVTSDAARAKPLTPPERLMFSAATRDPRLAAHVEAFAARLIGPRRLLAPWAIARAARVDLRARGSAARPTARTHPL